jgi:hypothetical protein
MQLVLIKLLDRAVEAVRLQEVLTRHGCDIALRLGLHEHTGSQCSNEGLIILQLRSDAKAVDSLVSDLRGIAPADQIVIKPITI